MNWFVNCEASSEGNGTKSHPFSRIQQAADCAKPGDTVLVFPGIYRESVDPKNGGTEDAPIEYRSVEPGKAIITGADPIKNWSLYKDTTWVAKVPNNVFGEDNPYIGKVAGDWFIPFTNNHRGEIYLNNRSMYEVNDLSLVVDPVKSKKSWDPEFSIYTWYTAQDGDYTVLYANFHDYDPNVENVEINIRRTCFFPSQTGRNYIFVKGFVIRQAATQWAPPTAFQEGMIGPHWSKGWVIEGCEISDSKCSGISLGKYLQPDNDNKWLKTKLKDGTQTQREAVCQAVLDGWSKETVGSHTIRNCHIHDCGQTGIVGHMGGVFSVIESNHIHHINHKQELGGAEIGGIKLHAAIDVLISHNHIHHCTRGIWLDWEAQGTRVSSNLFHDNTVPNATGSDMPLSELGEDLFIEVSHGPTLVDNNILLSDFALKLPTQGVALAHNLITGSITAVGRGVNNGTPSIPSPRYTPYHLPHSTSILGFMSILHGDIRFYHNIFVQKPIRPCIAKAHECMKDGEWSDGNPVCGTIPYEKYPTEEEFLSRFRDYCGMGSQTTDRYYDTLPVWSRGNAFFAGAIPMKNEQEPQIDITHKITIDLESVEGNTILKTNLFQYLLPVDHAILKTSDLGVAFEPEQPFDAPDGSEIILDTDFWGNQRSNTVIPGPFAVPASNNAIHLL